MRKILPALVIVLGSVLILSGIGIFVIQPAIQDPGSVSLPSQISDLTLVFPKEGLNAIAEFNRLHQQEFPLIAGAVGTYGFKQDVKLWVGETFFKSIAGKMIADMGDKIALGSSPFTPTEVRQQAGHTIYALDGMGQKHFYFQSGKLIIWLAANENIAEQALVETLEFYP